MTDDERQANIAEFADACEKMTDKERQAEIAGIRKELVILPRKPPDVDEGPYEANMTEETDMTKQADAVYFSLFLTSLLPRCLRVQGVVVFLVFVIVSLSLPLHMA